MNAAAKAADPSRAAWQPLTFGGVASFAGGKLGRLLVFELATASLTALMAVWLLHRAYCPVVLQFIQKMPETAQLAHGTLHGVPESLTAESKFLAIVAQPQSGEAVGQDADLQIQLRQSELWAGSVFWPNLVLDIDYGSGTSLSLARSNLEPAWSAWQPVLLIGTGAVVVVSLLVIWGILAGIYMAPARFIAWFADRDLTWGGAWRLASAALLPGAAVMAGSLLLYGWGLIDLLGLSFFFAVHALAGWIYLIGGACKVPQAASNAAKDNPFLP